MTRFPDYFTALAAPFDPQEVKSRQGSQGRSLHYVTARTVMNRFDSVCGPENWTAEFTETRDGLKCRLSVRLPDGEWVAKEDGGGSAGMAAGDDNEKSAYSDALKRAAVHWGPGRYLYRDGVPEFAGESSASPSPASTFPPASEGKGRKLAAWCRSHQCIRPAIEWARVEFGVAAIESLTDAQATSLWEHLQARPAAAAPAPPPPPQANGSAPRSGKALFAWTKEMEQRHEIGLLKYLNDWSKQQDFPGRMVDWAADQVALAHGEALRKLASVESQEAPESFTPPASSPYRLDPTAAPDGGSSPTPYSGDLHPPVDPKLKPEIKAIQDMLQASCLAIARLQTNKPEGKIDGKAVSQALSCVARDLSYQGKRTIHTCYGCDDLELLADYLTAAELMIDRLKLAPSSAPRQMEIAS